MLARKSRATGIEAYVAVSPDPREPVLAAKSRAAMWRVRATVAAAVFVVAAFSSSAVAEAHRGDGIFTLSEGPWMGGNWVPRDVAMLSDGSIVGVTDSGAWRLTPDGRRSSIPGFGGTGVAATTDGGALAIQGGVVEPWPGAFEDYPPGPLAEHRIVRWTPGVGVSIVAGTGEAGFGGDGGPATEALLNLGPTKFGHARTPPTGVVARPDGGFVFVDTGNGRIRAVDPAGAIHSIAGSSAGAFRDPVGLAQLTDGGHLVMEAGWPGFRDGLPGRLRRVRADGSIETVARLGYGVEDIAVLADGDVVIAGYDGRLWRLDPGSGTLRPYLRAKHPTEPFDFAARSTFGWRLGLGADGGLLAVGSGALDYVPAGPTPWMLAALRSTRTSPRGVTAVAEATQAGSATLEVSNEAGVVARVTKPVASGHFTLRARGPIRSDWYDVVIRLGGATGATARDHVPIHGATGLTVRLAQAMLGRSQGREEDSATRYRLSGDCRRFGTGRVDCVVETHERRIVGVASVTLERSGVVLRRDYRWSREGFRRNPRFITAHGVRRLSRDDGGTWTSPSR
jgi:hypothetical protein